MYKACMFDLDGTLANTLESIAHFGNTALESHGFPAINSKEYKKFVGNGADKLICRMLLFSGAELTEGLVSSVRKEYDRLYESDPMKLVTYYEGTQGLIGTLREKGIKAAVLSNKPDDMTKLVAAGLYGNDAFEIIQGQLEGIPKKPAPTAPLDLLSRMGVKPEECLYIGDSGVDMETGRNAGMTTVGVTWGFRDEEELRNHGAVHIVDTAEELRAIIFSE